MLNIFDLYIYCFDLFLCEIVMVFFLILFV